MSWIHTWCDSGWIANNQRINECWRGIEIGIRAKFGANWGDKVNQFHNQSMKFKTVEVDEAMVEIQRSKLDIPKDRTCDRMILRQLDRTIAIREFRGRTTMNYLTALQSTMRSQQANSRQNFFQIRKLPYLVRTLILLIFCNL